MAAYPSSLPQSPLLAALTAQAQDNRLAFDPDVGDQKVRRRFTATLRDFTYSTILTQAQVSTLDTFYATTLNDGIDTFTWTDPMLEVSGTFRFLGPIQWTAATKNAWRATARMRRIS